MARHFLPIVLSALILIFLGCTPADDVGTNAASAWTGTIDTLASGTVAVHNAGTPYWSHDETWQVVEKFRLGSGDILFGSIRSFDVDQNGRVYVLDNQSQEIHIFDAEGTFVRTAGGQGTGPGEFERASAVDISPKGEIWVMEMPKGQLTALDSNGIYQRREYVNSTGTAYSRYPGGMDRVGRYNGAVYNRMGEGHTFALARFDASFAPIDTVPIPMRPVDPEFFEHLMDDGRSRIRAAVPYQGSHQWRFSTSGHFWTLYTGTYELAEITPAGEVLRIVTLDFEPLPVTAQDKAQVRDQLRWFTRQGGSMDLSRIPNTKPVVSSFFVDDIGSLWVQRVALESDDEGRIFDVFDADGRFLGQLRLPFALDMRVDPVVMDGVLYGVGEEANGASIIVVASIERPGAA
ncbi:MAG: 6-bladed beta-propeller [Bacteroidota bacterium]|nr:6-bladed beta-propeller [Bacteroidota bacterium]